MPEHGSSERDVRAVTLDEFDTLCSVVELVLGIPGGVLDHITELRWDGRAALDRFAEMRRAEHDPRQEQGR